MACLRDSRSRESQGEGAGSGWGIGEETAAGGSYTDFSIGVNVRALGGSGTELYEGSCEVQDGRVESGIASGSFAMMISVVSNLV